ncbi:MAG: c-type cytochrome [Nitrospirae bacterium]|nr:c-type cytochrome [Nitrospirota bacterium]
MALFLLTISFYVGPVSADDEGYPGFQGTWKAVKPSEADLKAGEKVYFRKCVWCHGETGAGNGPGADRLWPRPRSFNEGTFKVRSTATGELPIEQDLIDTITNGLPGSAMPPWDRILSATEIKHVAAFVRTKLITDRDYFDAENEPFHLINFGKEVASSEESIKKGREIFTSGKAKCAECHGEEGRGDGNKTQKDEWGFPIMPADLHKCWNFRGSRRDPYSPRNIVREITTGLNGTPMPSFAEQLNNEDRWHIANFVNSLCPKLDIDPLTDKPKISFVLKSRYHKGEIPNNFDDQAWKEIAPIYVGLAGQIIHKPRNFVRQVDEVWVRSIYNEKEIGIMFEWDDRTKSTATPEALKVAETLDPAKYEIPPSGTPVAYRGLSEWPVFNDAVAIQFPAKWKELVAPEKPRFVFGDKKNAVDLWKWDAAGEFGELTGHGVLDVAPRSKNIQVLKAEYKDGQWRLIIKRSLTTSDPENDVQFETGKYIPTAFFAWDGHNGDTGAKMSLSTWYYTILEPPVPMTVYVYPPIVMVLVVGLEVWVRRQVVKSNGKGGGKK